MDGITGVGSTPTNSASQASATGLADNFDTFLTLLTTQLQNQDPLSPMESNEFTQQLVQFSQVEQSIATNTNLEGVLALLGASNTANTVAFIGKDVAVAGGTNGLVDGKASWEYDLPAGAAKVTLTVTDADGKLVYTGDGDVATGSHTFDWNGKDNAGDQLADGVYTLGVLAKDSDGGVLEASLLSLGRVTGVQTGTNGAEFLLGEAALPVSSVVQVKEPAPSAGQQS